MIALSPKPRAKRQASCVGCGKSADDDAGDDELPRGWRLIVVEPALAVCSDACADFILLGKRERR